MEHRASGRVSLRTCIGCRSRAAKSDLLRVVAFGAGPGEIRGVVPDPRGRLPGRGAYLHPEPGCFDLAERRRAFTRALRLRGPFDLSALRRWFEERAPSGGDAGRR